LALRLFFIAMPIDRFQAEEVLSDIERRCRGHVSGIAAQWFGLHSAVML
jgi:hypothetical protein